MSTAEFSNPELVDIIKSHEWIVSSKLAHIKMGPTTAICGKTHELYLKVTNLKAFIPDKLCKVCLRMTLKPKLYKEVYKNPALNRFTSLTYEKVLANKVLREIISTLTDKPTRYSDIKKIVGDGGRTAYYINKLLATKIIEKTGLGYSLNTRGLVIRGIIQLISKIDSLSEESIQQYETSVEKIIIVGNENKFLKRVIREVIEEIKE